MRSLYSHLPVGSRQSLAIQGANHFTFGDDGVAVWSGLLLRGLRTLRVLKIDARRQVAITRYVVRTFFDAHLTNARATPLTLLSPEYPELETLDIR
jgi:hypothetical protein